MLAYRTSLDGRLAPAVDVYAEAARRFDDLGDPYRATAARAMRAEILAELGRQDEAVFELAAVLPVAASMRDPWQRYSTYWVAANALARTAPTAAFALWSEAAEACGDMPERPLCAVDARIRLARRTDHPAWALGELAAAGDQLELSPDSPDKDRTRLDLAMAEAEWLLQLDDPAPRDLEQAGRLYAEAIRGFETLGSPASVAEARAARAEVLTRLGSATEARAELEASLTSLRRWDDDQRFRPEAAESGTPHELRMVFERLIRLHLAESGGQVSRSALVLAEEMRDRLAPRSIRRFRALSEEDVMSAVEPLPPGTVVVEMAVLSPLDERERLAVAWILSTGFLEQVALPVASGIEKPLADTRRAAAARDLAGWTRATGELWRGLLAPVLAELPRGTRRLVIVPDSELYGVPFRGLWNPETERYLDEELEVILAPSLRFLQRSRPEGEPHAPPGPLLAAGFASFPALGLSDLASAASEIAAVADFYGETATSKCAVTDWPSLTRCLPEAGVAHLATHAAASSELPGWSWLALPQETVSLERLWSELPPLPRRPLIVLSACESVATARGGEGLGGLARPFLARGARSVVGTLWPIIDSDAADFFPLFHQAYVETRHVTAALRQARERLDDWPERPWTWAAVMALGTEN